LKDDALSVAIHTAAVANRIEQQQQKRKQNSQQAVERAAAALDRQTKKNQNPTFFAE
jgi:predicted LPLAT superfamily acyltransferase